MNRDPSSMLENLHKSDYFILLCDTCSNFKSMCLNEKLKESVSTICLWKKNMEEYVRKKYFLDSDENIL